MLMQFVGLRNSSVMFGCDPVTLNTKAVRFKTVCSYTKVKVYLDICNGFVFPSNSLRINLFNKIYIFVG